MWEFDCEEGWVPKNWCFWTVVLKKTLESPLDCKGIQPVHSEDQPWDFFGRNGVKAEAPVLWPLCKSWLIGKDSDAGRDWGQEEKGTTEDEMAGWHHGLDGHESEWTPGDGDGQGGLACWDSWGRKESDRTERLNWAELNWTGFSFKVMVKNSDRLFLRLKALGISCTSPGITKQSSINHSLVSQLQTHTCSGNNSPEGTVTSHRLLRANGTLMTSLLSTAAALGGETKRKEYFRTCTKRGRIQRFPSLGWLINEPTHCKRSDAGKAWRQEEKGMTEVEIIGWYHWFNGCKFEQTPGDGEGQGSLVWCSPWGSWTVRHNWANE